MTPNCGKTIERCPQKGQKNEIYFAKLIAYKLSEMIVDYTSFMITTTRKLSIFINELNNNNCP
jgi:hypothetical protein